MAFAFAYATRMSNNPLNPTEIETALKDLPHWEHADDALKTEIKLDDFSQALGLITRIGLLAEKADHHPELFNVYNTIRISLSTHDADGKVTRKDVDLAREIASLLPR
ncbi:MAG: 4a-hydroxytetrahydrobiopterin dehydratase [Opitutales bacterium]